MSSHPTLSTRYSDSNRLGGWQSAAISLEFFFWGGYVSKQRRTREISNNLPNGDAGAEPVVYFKLDKCSGRCSF
ncbi:hypothetical protein [Lyngbya aestuarii]|uniref:hypothetical protein n=1 Tax=Lyngbya aestuarii TaxID=118322 RepID=UPI00403D8934